MAEYLNKTCSICGSKYHACDDCANEKNTTPWKKITCTANCYSIFLILNKYTNKYISKEEAKRELSNYDLSKIDNFEENIKLAIKEIMKETKNRKSKATSSEEVTRDDIE